MSFANGGAAGGSQTVYKLASLFALLLVCMFETPMAEFGECYESSVYTGSSGAENEGSVQRGLTVAPSLPRVR